MNIVPPHADNGKFDIPQTTFIYALVDPETNQVCYVGKANDPQYRYKGHLREKNNAPKARWISGLKERGLKPLLNIVEEVPFAQWQEREMYWISYYHEQGCPLVNLSLGGEGGLYNTPSRSAKVSAHFLGRTSPIKGRKRPPYSAEWCANMSASRKGKKQSPETVAKRVTANAGRKHSSEARAKISEAAKKRPPTMTGKKHSPETKAKMSVSRKRVVAMKKALLPANPTLWD